MIWVPERFLIHSMLNNHLIYVFWDSRDLTYFIYKLKSFFAFYFYIIATGLQINSFSLTLLLKSRCVTLVPANLIPKYYCSLLCTYSLNLMVKTWSHQFCSNVGIDLAVILIDPYENVLYFHADSASPLAWGFDHCFPCSSKQHTSSVLSPFKVLVLLSDWLKAYEFVPFNLWYSRSCLNFFLSCNRWK